MLTRTTTGAKADVKKVIEREALQELMALVREVPVASHVKDYAVRLVLATHPKSETAAPDFQPIFAIRQQPARRANFDPGRESKSPDAGALQCEL